MTTKRIINLNTLVGNTNEIVKNKNDLIVNQTANASIFNTRKYKVILDKLLLSHIKGQKIKEFISELHDPFELFDLSVVLEYIMDAFDSSFNEIKINERQITGLLHQLINNKNSRVDFYNYDEEVLF